MSKYIIIGGVAGGATTAARLRRLDEQAEILMFERGKNISYANCGLPYYIGEVIKEREKLLVQTPESFNARFNIDIRVESEVIDINRQEKTVTVRDIVKGEEYTESYDKLILAPGAEPVRPSLPGIKDEKIFTVRNVKDTDTIKGFIDTQKPKHALVVGAGFIGLEMAENLHHRGILVTIVEMAGQMMSPLDYEMAAEVHQHLKTKDVEFFLGVGVSAFSSKGSRLEAQLTSGRSLETDMVILSIGVRPESQLARKAQLELGEKGGIVVNDYLQTSDPNIYALGDAIEFRHPILGTKMPTYLAGPANKQGRMVADNIVRGNKRIYKGAIGTAIAKVFDITVAACGVPEKELKKRGIPYEASITHGSSHAGYYPDAMPLSMKIVFDPESGKLFGAQIVGYEGVDKRIDLIATVLQHGGTIFDLEEIEHAYAPPFSSAKDPVNIAGFVAENIMDGTTRIAHWNEVAEINDREWNLVDVRTADEFSLGTIEGAMNIPVDELRFRMGELTKEKKILVFCGVGLRGHVAARMLSQMGYEVWNLSGGYKTYEHATQKQSNEDIFENEIIGKDDLIISVDKKAQKATHVKTLEIDACGLQCPGPIMKLKEAVMQLADGERIRQIASDPGFYKDVQSWCKVTGNTLVSVAQEKGKVIAEIEKGLGSAPKKQEDTSSANVSASLPDNKTIVVFSDDMDRALASLVIANGAAAMGKKVTLFFTFWGLNLLKDPKAPKVKKDFMSKAFGAMMPGSAEELKLSKMNMGGMGSKMMSKRMKSKKIASVQEMLQSAVDNGVELLACQMSMDVMGVSPEELRPGVVIGGVAAYLEEAEQANLNLFI
ncbi:MAG: CoA-disulfide reductase [Bacteroidota bacterium]